MPRPAQSPVRETPPEFRVLVAEDTPNDRLILQRAFEKAGLQAFIHFAEDGQQVIDYLSGKPPFNNRLDSPLPTLLLLDLKMPVRDGFEVLEWLRIQPELSDLVVIVLSGSNLPADMARARSLGARHYLVKPTAFPELVRLALNLKTLWHTLLSHGRS